MSRINKYRKRNTFQKHLEIFLTKCNISLKENKEYKIQLWSVILFDTIIFLVMILFFSIYGKLIFNFLQWELYDFILLFCLLLLTAKILWMHHLKFFSHILIQGKLNLILLKPVNPYFFANTLQINGANIVTGTLTLIITLIIALFGNYNNYIISILIFLFGNIFYIAFYNFLASIAFFIKSNEFLVNIITRKINFTIENYTPKLFLNTPFKWIAFLMPSSIYGFFVIESLKNRFELFLYFIPYFIFLFISFLIGIYLLWKYGLKRYEGYG